MKLLTWNIQWGRGTDGCVDLSRSTAVAAQHAPDVLCLQEVARFHPDLPGGAADDQVACMAARFPGFEAVYGIGSDLSDGRGGRRQFGNLILSRFPVLQSFRHLLPWPADPAVPSMQRVAVEAVLAAPFGSLRIVTTHLEYYSQLQRTAQIEALRRLQAEAQAHAVAPRSMGESDPPFAVVPRGEFAVFCGDFNSPAGSPEYRMMQAFIAPEVPALVDAWSVAYPGVPHPPTAGLVPLPWISGPACYDFCFVSANLAGRVVDVQVDADTRASDHQPVLLQLRDS